jgi:hypothetical protein
VPLPARTSREAFRALQGHVNGMLNKVLTRYRLEFFVRTAAQDQATLAFFDRRRVAVAVSLPPSLWYLHLGLELKAVPEEKGYGLQMLKYAYRIQRTPSLQDEAEVRFEYVSRELDPSARWCRHHVQFHRDYQNVRDSFSPNELHIPTGWVTIENVIRFLITDMRVPPLIEQWEEELEKSEELTREWIGCALPK